MTLQKVYYVDDDACPAVGSGTELEPYCEIRVAEGTYTDVEMATDNQANEYQPRLYLPLLRKD